MFITVQKQWFKTFVFLCVFVCFARFFVCFLFFCFLINANKNVEINKTSLWLFFFCIDVCSDCFEISRHNLDSPSYSWGKRKEKTRKVTSESIIKITQVKESQKISCKIEIITDGRIDEWFVDWFDSCFMMIAADT